jgi:hypothetical protein
MAVSHDQRAPHDAATFGGRTRCIVPSLDPSGLTDDRKVLFSSAESAIAELVDFDVDALEIELVLAMLIAARELDEP